MEVIELKPFGYCYGVEEALKIIEEVKDKHQDKNVYVFGMLVHNNDVVKHLESKNVITIDTTKVNKLERLEKFTSDDVVVFTAHGHVKKYEEILEKNGVIFYDATCKNVLKNMKLIEEYSKEHQIVYIGKTNHPETDACLSISNNIMLYDIKYGMDFSSVKDDRIVVTNQTTLSLLEIEKIHQDIKSRYPNAIFIDEICSQTRVRQQNILKSIDTPDLVLIIGSIQSSNTDKLYDISKEKFSKAVVLKVENLVGLKKYDLSKYKKCLITSGTSTPLSSILEIKDYLMRL